MSFFRRSLLVHLVVLEMLVPAQALAGSPVIWGPSGSAPMLNAGQIVTKDGTSIGSNGPLNLAKNTDAAVNLSGITDLGTGTTVSRTTTSSEIALYPKRATAIKIANDGSGTGSTRLVCFQIPAALKNTKLGVSFSQIPGAGYAAGDYTLDVYSDDASDCSGTETRLSLSTDSSSVTSLPASTGKFASTFDTTTADYYEVRITRAAGSSGATYWLSVGDVYVGPGTIVQGYAGGDITLAPTVNGFGTVSGTSYTATREGSWLRLTGHFQAGTVAASTASIDLPAGYTLDQARLASDASGQSLGRYTRVISGAANDIYGSTPTAGVVFYDASDTNTIFFAKQDGSNVYTKINGSSVCNSSDRIDFDVRLPIAEWAGSGTVNLTQNDYECVYNTSTSTTTSDTTSFAYGRAGAQIQSITATLNRRVRFPTKIVNIADIKPQVSYDQVQWFSLPAAPNNTIIETQRFDGTNIIGIGTVDLGASNNGTDVDIRFGIYRSGTSTTWAAASTLYWRACKPIGGGGTLGFEEATQNSLGLVKAGQVPGTNTNDSATAGNVGELASTTSTSSFNQSAATVNTYYDVSSFTISPTAGQHQLTANVGATALWTVGAACVAYLKAAIRDSSNNVIAETMCGTVGDGAAGRNPPEQLISPCNISADVQLSGTTTYKYSVRWGLITGTCTTIDVGARCDLATCSLSARRVR